MWPSSYYCLVLTHHHSGGNDAAIICEDVNIDEVAPKVRQSFQSSTLVSRSNKI